MGSAGIRERRAFVLIHMFFAKYINSKVWGSRANSHSGFKVTRCRCARLYPPLLHTTKRPMAISLERPITFLSVVWLMISKNVSLTEKGTWISLFPNGTSLGFCHSVKLLRNQEKERMYIFIRRKNSLGAASSSSSLSAIWLSIMSSASSSITKCLMAFPWKLLLLCLDTKNYSWKE